MSECNIRLSRVFTHVAFCISLQNVVVKYTIQLEV